MKKNNTIIGGLKALFSMSVLMMAIGTVGSTMSSCSEDVLEKIDCRIGLDASNTYKVGEPVKFNFDGDVDNIVLYTGEAGSEYKNKDRFVVSVDDVEDVSLNLDFQARYGMPGALEVYVSNTFKGLKGTDAKADKSLIQDMVAGGMEGWTKLDYQEGKSKAWTHQTFDLTPYLDNFALAFHWNPQYDGKNALRTYWVNGKLNSNIKGSAPSSTSLIDLGLISVMVNEEKDDNPYVNNAGNGSIIFNKQSTANVIFQGANKKYPNSLDGWVFSVPRPLNKVNNDKPVVIKNLQNYMDEYSYVYEKPGTYEAYFIMKNENYKGSYMDVKHFTINITD